MSEPLYAVSLVLLSAVAPVRGVLSVSSSAGNIYWKVLSRRMFPWAPVYTLAFRVCSPGRPVTLILGRRIPHHDGRDFRPRCHSV